MAWAKGQSGNPTGRPKKGSELGVRAALREQIAAQLPAVVVKLIKLAKAGDVAAARTLLERVVPPIRAEVAPVNLPALAAAGDFTAAAQALIKAAAEGEVPFDAAASLLSGIAAAARTTEIDDLARRLEKLEQERT